MAFFVVEGNIGAGKSTFLRHMGRYLNAQLVFEPTQLWCDVNGENLLDAFYADGKRWAYTFQTYAFVTRTIEQKRLQAQNEKPFQLLERSIYADRYCFAKNAYELGLMSKLEWQMYQNWFIWLTDYTEQPAGFIYLRADPEVCYDRLVGRGRCEEKGIQCDYISCLHNKHEDWLMHKKDVTDFMRSAPVLVLDCNESFESNIALQKRHARDVVDFLSVCGLPAEQTVAAGIIL